MIESLVRLLAFFGKEFNEIRRQPRLVLSLLAGPLAILLLVGAGYRGERPPMRVALVIPPALQGTTEAQNLTGVIDLNFNLVATAPTLEEVEPLLESGDVDLIQIIPEDIPGSLNDGGTATIEFIYDVVNPRDERYIRFTSLREVDAFNDVLLQTGVEEVQTDTGATLTDIQNAQSAVEDLQAGIATAEEAADSLDTIQETLALLATYAGTLPEDHPVQADLQALQQDVDAVERTVQDGTGSIDSERLAAMQNRLNSISDEVEVLGTTPAEDIVSPLRTEHTNRSAEVLSLVTYFAPAVAAFILQHIAVTLGALSLVRERMRGTRELYASAPMSTLQVLVGKYGAYLLFTGIIAALLIALLVFVLSVPFEGTMLVLLGFSLLFLLASISVGFLISVVSPTDIQAVQLAMLVLLLAVFFSGFVIPTNFYTEAVGYVGLVLPVTHMIEGLQAILFRGLVPGWQAWAGLITIALVTASATVLLWQIQFRRAV